MLLLVPFASKLINYSRRSESLNIQRIQNRRHFPSKTTICRCSKAPCARFWLNPYAIFLKLLKLLNKASIKGRGSKGSPPEFSVTNFRSHEWPGGSNWQNINNSKWPIPVWNLQNFKIHLILFVVLLCNVYLNTPKNF